MNRLTDRQGAGGFSLVEVMLAVLLLSVLLGATTQAVLDLRLRAMSVADRQGVAGERARADDVSAQAAWHWGGLLVARAVWEWGPVLAVQVKIPPAETSSTEQRGGTPGVARFRIGAWIDGWFAGEGDVADGHSTLVGPGLPGYDGWPELWEDAEVIVRARGDGAAWGVPWRTLAPSSDGPAPTSPVGPEGMTEAAGVVPGAGILLHGRMAGFDEFTVRCGQDLGSLQEVELPNSPHLGGPLVVPLPPGTVAAVEADGRIQSLWNEAGRWVDVYF